MTTLALFDIDGTILWGRGVGRPAMESALTEVFGTRGPDGYHYDGKTDRQIVRELMRLAGRDDAHIDARMATLLERYVAGLHENLASGRAEIGLLPGVATLLDALEARDDVVLGLLTGNIEIGARAKLAAVGLDFARFRVNAFGSDAEHRPDLPAVAQQRARAALGFDLPGAAIVVIGDTPADIGCAKGIAARTIGVATGRYTVAELAAHAPTAVFASLMETARVIEVIVGTG